MYRAIGAPGIGFLEQLRDRFLRELGAIERPLPEGGFLHRGEWRPSPVRQLQLELPPDGRAPGVAREATLGMVSAELRESLVHSSLMLVSEAVTSRVRHGGGARDRPVELHLALAPSKLRVEVCDDGPAFDPDGLDSDDDAPALGMLLLSNLADRWGVAEDGHTCMWFELDCGSGYLTP